MRKFSLFLLALPAVVLVHAQKNGRANAGGLLTITKYDENIYKITYHNYFSNADGQVSDAVILPPLQTGKKDSRPGARRGMPPIYVSGDTVYRGNKPFLFDAYSTKEERGFSFPLKPGEAVFGGGERALPLNRRGYRLPLYNNPWYGYSEGADNLNFSLPFITSSEGYGLFFDNPSRGLLDIGKTDPAQIRYRTASGELNVYLILGNYAEVLDGYYRLTGTQPLPPRWALGNLMSRFGYTSEVQVDSIARAMQRKNIPIDAVIFDLFWFGDSIKGTMGNLDWVNRQAWPDPKGMIGRFKEEGIHTVLVTEPFFVKTAKNYAAAKPYLATDCAGRPYELTDFYFGRGGLLDIFRPDAQQWFWQFYKKQIDNAVDGWWGDLGEPEKHPEDLYHRLPGHARPLSANEVHNVYGYTWTKMLAQYYAKEVPAQRLFSLNRAGFAGAQRYSIFPWTGDVSRSWSGFRAQLPVLLGMSMSGIPYVHSDAGGFAGGSGDNELYVRWLQFAVYTPIFRPHGTALYAKDPGAFSFPSEAALIDPPYGNLAREAIAQRYRFLPYNYSLAYAHARNRQPLMAPLYYYFMEDTAARAIENEYMWGSQVLVAPVLEPAPATGLPTRRFYLPAGDWYEVSKKRWRKGGWQVDTVGLAETPVFYRAGSIIPQADLPEVNGRVQLTNTAAYHGDHILLTYVESDKPSVYEWYEDDGAGPANIAEGKYELIRIASTGRSANGLQLSIRSNGGRYAGRPATRALRVALILKNGRQARFFVNGAPVRAQGDPAGTTFLLPVPFTGAPVTLRVKW